MLRVDQMSARDFEELCRKLLEAEGFSVRRPGGAERGYDFLATRDQQSWVVECKRSLRPVRLDKELLELLSHRKLAGADKALFITSAMVASSVRESELDVLDIEIWDGSDVQRLLDAHPELATDLSDQPTRRAGYLRLQRLGLKNFRGISEMELDLDNESNMIVLAGRNGSGKSTILEALAMLLSWPMRRIASSSKGKLLTARDMRKGTKSAEIRLEADLEGETLFWGLDRSIHGRRGVGAFLRQRNPSSAFDEDLNGAIAAIHAALESEPGTSIPLAVYYPVNRAVLDIPRRIRKKHDFSQLMAYEDALVAGNRDFRLFFEWFRQREDLENEKKTTGGRGYRDPQLEAVRQAIPVILPGYSDLRIRREPQRMTLKKNGREFDVTQLSDGEKCLLAMVGDLARRLAMANPGLERPLEGSGVALIDEIELHLHPGWQRRVMPRLRQAFPNCQFVVTTHSPHVISSVDRDAVKLLEDGALVPDTPHTRGRDSNAILSDVMGEPPHSPEIEEKLHAIARFIEDEELDQARQAVDELARQFGEQDSEIVRMRSMIQFLAE